MRLINKYRLEDVLMNAYSMDEEIPVQSVIDIIDKEEVEALPSTDRQDVLERAIGTYGTFSQMDMAIEEMSELMKALLKEKRAYGSKETRAAIALGGRDMFKNSEGYPDPTAGKAYANIRRGEMERESAALNRISALMRVFKAAADLAGFDITERVSLRDKETGREYR